MKSYILLVAYAALVIVVLNFIVLAAVFRFDWAATIAGYILVAAVLTFSAVFITSLVERP